MDAGAEGEPSSRETKRDETWIPGSEPRIIKIDLDDTSEAEIQTVVSKAREAFLKEVQNIAEEGGCSDYGLHVDAADRPFSASLEMLDRLDFVDGISLTGKYLDSSILENMQFENSVVRHLVLHEVAVRARDVRFLKAHRHLDYISLAYCRIGPGVFEALHALPFTGEVYVCGDLSKEDEVFLKQLDQKESFRVVR